jgi:hypothetical protein
MARIEGRTGNLATVNDDEQLETRAVTESDLEFASERKGKAYAFNSTYAATGGQEVLSIKNTSTTDCLIVDEVIVGSTVNTLFTLFEVTSGTAAGTTVTGQNLNLGSGNAASATAFGNASVTGSLSGNAILYEATLANATQILDLKGALALGQDDEIAITASATGTVYITLIGHYKQAS